VRQQVEHTPEFYFKTYADIAFDIDPHQRNAKMDTAVLSAVTLDFALPDKGFHVKSTRDVQVGELLLVERPYASVLLGSHFETNCLECMLHLDATRMNITFCAQCATVQYCSPACEQTGWHAHHKYECKYIKLLAFDSGLTHMEWLALRIVLRAGNEPLLAIKAKLEAYELSYEHLTRIDPTGDPFFQQLFASPAYNSHSYLSIFNLVTNSAVRKLSDLFRRSFVSLLLVKLLYKVKFIDQAVDERENEFENGVFIGGLLLRHLQSISCNAHEVSRLQMYTEHAMQPMAKVCFYELYLFL
jgi:hypothetical protein